jgi:hypothetical protein
VLVDPGVVLEEEGEVLCVDVEGVAFGEVVLLGELCAASAVAEARRTTLTATSGTFFIGLVLG